MNKSILHINASARFAGSVTREVSQLLVAQLQGEVTVRDLASGVAFIDEEWVAANFTNAEQRTTQQKQKLALSDLLVEEMTQADQIVIAAPIYNFSIPATLKAWIDQVARAGLTFRYTENGPEGLLADKKTYIVMASGGVPLGSEVDYASSYLKHVLQFMGITDVTLINANDKVDALAIIDSVKDD